MTEGAESSGSIIAAILWMFLISTLLFWLPFLGPLLAGIVGGKSAGSVGSAIVAVFLPSLVFGTLIFLFASVAVGWPVIGMVAGFGAAALAAVQLGPLLLGAIIGGIIA